MLSGSLLWLVEQAAKQSQHSRAASVGGLLSWGQGAEGCPEATGGCRLAVVSCSSPKCQLGLEHCVDEPLPQSSLRQRGHVMALEDGARVGGGNNGCCIVLEGGWPSIDCCTNVQELLYLLEGTEMERFKDHLEHKLTLVYGVLNVWALSSSRTASSHMWFVIRSAEIPVQCLPSKAHCVWSSRLLRGSQSVLSVAGGWAVATASDRKGPAMLCHRVTVLRAVTVAAVWLCYVCQEFGIWGDLFTNRTIVDDGYEVN